MTPLFSKQNISYGLIALAVILTLVGISKKSKNTQYYFIVAVASFVTGLIMLFTNKEKFQHAATHKIVLENEKGGYIPGMTNKLSDYVPQEIPKSGETPYANDCSYKQDISSELYEGFEQEDTEQSSQEPNIELPDNETPVTTMTQPDIEDSVVVPRIIKALPNKRNRGQGDPIRGDLAIAPEPCGWFRPSASPNIDLRQGALNVIAGEGNEQGKAITDLINSTSGSIYIAGTRIDEPESVIEPSQAKYAL
jgi:hypothetical protein